MVCALNKIEKNRMKQNPQQEYEKETKTEIKKGNGCTIPLNGCLYSIILAAIACMMVKGCKMVSMKYDEAKVQHEIYMDSINKVKSDTLQYRGR